MGPERHKRELNYSKHIRDYYNLYLLFQMCVGLNPARAALRMMSVIWVAGVAKEAQNIMWITLLELKMVSGKLLWSRAASS